MPRIFDNIALELLPALRQTLQISTRSDYESPLTEAARDLLNRELRAGVSDEKLVPLVLSLHEEDRLSIPKDDVQAREPKIICSLGIREDQPAS